MTKVRGSSGRAVVAVVAVVVVMVVLVLVLVLVLVVLVVVGVGVGVEVKTMTKVRGSSGRAVHSLPILERPMDQCQLTRGHHGGCIDDKDQTQLEVASLRVDGMCPALLAAHTLTPV